MGTKTVAVCSNCEREYPTQRGLEHGDATGHAVRVVKR